MSPLWRAPATTGQSVADSFVFGDITQIQNITGDVIVTTRKPLAYSVTPLPTAAVDLTIAQALAQPSRLLLPRYRIVPFTGRDSELTIIADWLVTPDPIAVCLIHAAGGHGKTRLAGYVATKIAKDWMVWRVTHTATTAMAPDRTRFDGKHGILAIIDYADRWPPSDLISFVADLLNFSLKSSVAVRILMLARSAGYWWQSVSDRLDSDYQIDSNTLRLPPLGTEVDRTTLFHAAAAQFAARLDPQCTAKHASPTPPDLDESGYVGVLAIHMAALVAVDSRLRGTVTTTLKPHSLSAYLLRREQTHWTTLHDQHRVQARPERMRRTVYIATLTGAIAHPLARTALTASGVAASTADADQLIDDHHLCYPPENPTTVLEALYPDRLAEDFLALTTPGHPFSSDMSPDAWASDAAQQLLAQDDGDSSVASWTPAAITVLVETAHRWPHITTTILEPLLRKRPNLAVTASGATLIRLTEIPDLAPDIIDAIATVLPKHRLVDLDVAAAAISDFSTPRRLAASTDPAEHAYIHTEHARRLANAGRRVEALAAAREATALCQRLAETTSVKRVFELAVSLTNLGMALSELGRPDQGRPAAEQAVSLLRRLAGSNPAAHNAYLPCLASSLNNLGKVLGELGYPVEARAAAQESVRHYTDLAQAGSTTDVGPQAIAVDNLACRLSEMDRHQAALPFAREAVELFRELAATNPSAHVPDLAISLDNLGLTLCELQRPAHGLPYIEEAEILNRQLVEINPAAHEPHLAISLNNLGIAFSKLGRDDEALTASEQAVAIYRRLAQRHPAAYLPGLANSLTNLGAILIKLHRPADAHSADADARDAWNHYRTAIGIEE